MPNEVQLAARPRADLGSANSRRLRRSGLIPGIVYGRGRVPTNVSVGERELFRALHTELGMNVLINLEIEGEESTLVLAREAQRNPVRDTIVHLDFLAVSRTEKISADVPVHAVGEAKGVRENDGMLDQVMHSLSIEAFPQSVPTSIEIDVSDLEVGDVLTVGDLTVPADVTVLIDADQPVLTILAATVAVEEEVLEGLEITEEGAAPAAEAGETPES